MIEWLAIPSLLIGAAFIPRKKMSEEKIIDEVFYSRGVFIKKGEEEKKPKLKSKSRLETYSLYNYQLPLGISISDVEKVIPAISEALQKEVEVERGFYLSIKVFHEKMPTNWNMDDDLLKRDTWEVLMGKNHEGLVYHDFDKYPHMLIGGVTRFGKTVLMKDILYSLVMNQSDNVEVYILDLKGGLEFSKYLGLPQVKAVASDVFEAVDVLDELVYSIKEREKYFKENGWNNIVDSPIKKRTFVIVDEGSELSPKMVQGKKKNYAEACQYALSEIARIAGGLGIRLIYGTQYPSKESVSMSIKMNIVARVSFVCASQVASRVILDEIGGESLPSIPGRAIYKLEKNKELQVPFINDKMMFDGWEEIDNEFTRTNGEVTDNRRFIGSDNNSPIDEDS